LYSVVHNSCSRIALRFVCTTTGRYGELSQSYLADSSLTNGYC